MNLTDTEIANLALDRSGSKQVISSIDDQTTTGRLCKRWYRFCKDYLLRNYPWKFATRAVALEEIDGDAMIGWVYQYRYPNTCAYARQVTDVLGARNRWYEVVPGQLPVQWMQPRIPFTISSDESGKIILTDLAEAYLVHTARIDDTSLFDEIFVSALSWRMAMELVTPLQSDIKNKSEATRQFVYEIGQAFSLSENEGSADAPPESPSIQARA